VVLLGYLAINRDLLLQVLHNVEDARLGRVHAIARSLQVDPVAGDPGPGEGDHYATKLVPDLAEDLPTAGHKVLVMLGIHGHGVLNDVVQLLDASLKVFFCLGNSLLCAYSAKFNFRKKLN
jgi:hypothetical protein